MRLLQIKKLSLAKETITRVKRYLTEWEKVFTSYSSKRDSIYKTYRAKKIKYQKKK
jgi:hypothetical protein